MAMDPNAAWKMFEHGMMCRSRSEIAEATDALVGWLEKGGVMPAELEAKMNRRDALRYLRDIRHVAEMI
jgi:hypothetical protein